VRGDPPASAAITSYESVMRLDEGPRRSAVVDPPGWADGNLTAESIICRT